ncbi:unnamed protein product [Ceutorhynchus assimilis]|uniref:THAP-type domain-containing protein n=1 Tax=Ceutorhynchus assimilis TaxID=467358 RepID=A0A9N9MZ42_9CUCU|nr:unnamed protein product [Ceutorhynchus assimilis]
MPRKCCVLGCRSNYDGTSEKVSVFQFPIDKDLKDKWLEAINRKDYVPSKYAGVCQKHFIEDEVVRSCDRLDLKTGKIIRYDGEGRFRITLEAGAIPKLTSVDLGRALSSFKSTTSKTLQKSKATKRKRKSMEHESSSDEDIPLGELRSQYLNIKTEDHIEFDNSDSNVDMKSNIKLLKQRFLDLLDQYEKLKHKHVELGQEIEALEKTNIELKCRIF